MSTMLDLANDSEGVIPLRESFPLALRGLWRRARGSVAFWGGLIIIAMVLYPTVLSIEQVRGERAGLDQWWTAYAVQVSNGLLVSLPMISAVAGWAGARARIARLVGARRRLLESWNGSWPVLVAAGLGYLISMLALALGVGWPAPVPPNFLVVVAQLAAVVAAIAIGYALGSVLPRVLVIFAAPAALLAVLVLCLVGQSSPISGQYLGFSSVPAAPPFLVVVAIGGIAAALALAVVALPRVWMRVIPVAGAIALVVALAGVAASPFGGPFFVARAGGELHCPEIKPVVCLWPEQEAIFGDSLRADMSDAYDRAVALGLPVDDEGPTAAAKYGVAGYSPDGSWGGSLPPSTQTQNLSHELLASDSKTWPRLFCGKLPAPR